jgi:hypothetical protein
MRPSGVTFLIISYFATFKLLLTSTMAYQSKNLSLVATILLALSSLSSVSAFLNPSHAPPRIKQHLSINSSRSSFHRPQNQRIPNRYLVSAAQSNDSDSTDSPLQDLSLIYSDNLESRPFITNGITASIIAATGDIVSQSGSVELALGATAVAAPFNYVTMLNFLLTSLLFEGPWMHAWYDKINEIGDWMEDKFQADAPARIAAQLFVDQSLGVILFYPIYFMVFECVGAVLSGRVPDLPSAMDASKADFAAILITQYKVWPAFTLINFTLVPTQFRVLASCSAAFFWNIYLTGTIASHAGLEEAAQAISSLGDAIM